MDRSKKRTDSEIERCVVCRKPTEYRAGTPIQERECYVEGAGQLCRKCFFEIYLKNGNEGTS